MLSDANFLKRLVEYDRDSITDGMLRQIARVIGDPNFTPDAVAKQSKAAQSMCLWVRAMHMYAKVAQLVAPKRARLHEAEESLELMNSHLQAKQAQLQVRVVLGGVKCLPSLRLARCGSLFLSKD